MNKRSSLSGKMRVKSRRIPVIFLALLLLLSVNLPSFAAGTGTSYRGMTGTYDEYSYADIFDFRFNLNYEWLIHGDNEVYFTDLARFAAVSSNAVYTEEEFRERPSRPGGRISESRRIQGNGTGFFTSIGLQDACFADVEAPGETDPNDISQLLLGHLSMEAGGTVYELIFVVARGSVTAEDWLSNADVGADTEAYRELTGEHPEWTDLAMHKGFCVTANRAYEVIEDYVRETTDPGAEKIYFLTGHSRGAAVANILGTYYEDRADCKSFTYTFASPRTTTASEGTAASYTTIFNLINSDDLVPTLPAENWGGFRRYGRDLMLVGDEYRIQYENATYYSYLPAGGEAVTALLSELIDSREALYEFDEVNSYVPWDTYSSKTKAERKCQELLDEMEEYGVSRYFRLSLEQDEKTGKWTFGYVYRPAYVVQLLTQYLNSDTVLELVLNNKLYYLSYTYEDAAKAFIKPILDGSFTKSHMPAIYYCLTSKPIEGQSRQFIPVGEYLLILLEQWWYYILIASGSVIGVILIVWGIRKWVKKKKQRPAE